MLHPMDRQMIFVRESLQATTESMHMSRTSDMVTLAHSKLFPNCEKNRIFSPGNTVTSPLRSLLLSPVVDLNSEVLGIW